MHGEAREIGSSEESAGAAAEQVGTGGSDEIESLQRANALLQAQLAEERKISGGREAILERVLRALRDVGVPLLAPDYGETSISQAVRMLGAEIKDLRRRLQDAQDALDAQQAGESRASVVVHRNERSEEIQIRLERNSRGHTWEVKYCGQTLADTLARIDEANAALRARYGEPTEPARG